MSENQQTFFDEAGALEALSQAGDPLETLSGCIDFEAFRAALEKAFIQGESKGPGGQAALGCSAHFQGVGAAAYL
jgi:hypothetical protein